jgi:hypothetical protein
MWNKKLKIALATKNVNDINSLISSMPQFETLKDMEEAFYLMKQAKAYIETLKDETLKDMNKIKASINFLKSSSHNKKIRSGISFKA